MSVQFSGRKENVFNKLNLKEKNSLNESITKIKEESNKDKDGEMHINNISDFQKNDHLNENDNIIKLKKGLNPANYKQNALETINNTININNNGLDNNYLCNAILSGTNINNYINNYYRNQIINIISRNIILKEQFNKIIELESMFNKLKEIGLKALSNTNNTNNYLLNCSRKIVNNSIKQFNKNNNLNKYNFYSNNFNQKEQKISKKDKKEKKEYINNTINKNDNKETNSNIKQNKSLINIQLILKGIEKRTVVRLHPIPQYYSSFDVSKLIDQYLHIENGKNQRIYKALYVPLSKIIGKNIGFCFIMMVEPKYVIDFYKTFNGIIFNKKKSRKPCSVIWADVQGDDFLKISDDPLRSPIIFKDLIDSK